MLIRGTKRVMRDFTQGHTRLLLILRVLVGVALRALSKHDGDTSAETMADASS